MLPPGLTLRRATLDDLETLRGLWRECRLPEHELERRFTEFQLAVDANGWILGGLGLRFAGSHGHLHSLGIRRADLEADLGAALLERALALAQQQGTLRLWTRDHSPFWTSHDFVPAGPAELAGLPAAWGTGAESWHTRKLRDEPLKLLAAEEQLEAFLELERLRTERLVRRGQVLRLVAMGIAAGIFGLALAVLVSVFRRSKKTAPR